MDEENEQLAAAPDPDPRPVRFASEASVVGILHIQGLLDESIRSQLACGRTYWALERSICRAMLSGERLDESQVLRAHELKSFDYRLLNRLLYRLRGARPAQPTLDFLQVDELLTDIADDLYDYEVRCAPRPESPARMRVCTSPPPLSLSLSLSLSLPPACLCVLYHCVYPGAAPRACGWRAARNCAQDDVVQGSFNVYRCLVHLHGAEHAQGRLAARISELETRHATLLAALEASVRDAYLRRMGEVFERPGTRTWQIPAPIVDETAYRASVRAEELAAGAAPRQQATPMGSPPGAGDGADEPGPARRLEEVVTVGDALHRQRRRRRRRPARARVAASEPS
jgi:hypothetical protein